MPPARRTWIPRWLAARCACGAEITPPKVKDAHIEAAAPRTNGRAPASNGASKNNRSAANPDCMQVPQDVVLNVGFAHAALVHRPTEEGGTNKTNGFGQSDGSKPKLEVDKGQPLNLPDWEVQIHVLDPLTRSDSELALWEYLDWIIDLPLLSEELTGERTFFITYDLQKLELIELSELYTQLDFVMRTVSWCGEPQRAEKWRRRCHSWRIGVREGFFLARLYFGTAFFMTEPIIPICLTTSLYHSTEEELVYEELKQGTLDEFHHDFADMKEMMPCLSGDEGDLDRSMDIISSYVLADDEEFKTNFQRAYAQKGKVESESPCQKDAPEKLQTAVDLGFAAVEQGYDHKAGMGFLKIKGQDAQITDVGLVDMLNFLDMFIDSENGKDGFSITYDMRELRTPSLAMFTCLAEWGTQPERQGKWESRNLVSKVVVDPGMRFALAKTALTTFFYICPPVCRTMLISDPDAADEDGVIFDPPHRQHGRE